MSIDIEKVGDRIWLRSERPITGRSLGIPGANFSKVHGPHWSLPLTMDTCHLLRERFGSELNILPDLLGWAREQRAEQRRSKELRDGTRPVVLDGAWAEEFPKLFKAVTKGRPYQALGAQWIAKGGNVLIGDTVGLGKTPQALAGVMESGVPGPYLIVCPKTAVEAVWAPEIRRWLPGHNVVTVPDGRAKRDAILWSFWPVNEDGTRSMAAAPSMARTWLIVHPEMVRTKSWWICRECGSQTAKTHKPKELVCGHNAQKTTTEHEHDFPQLFLMPWGAIIADESDRSILRATGTPTQTRNGMELLRDSWMREDGLRIAQSGTPFRSRPHLLWSTLNWLRPDEFPAFWRWAETFFNIEDGQYGGRTIGRLKSEREGLLYSSLDRIMLRRTREEVLPHLPKKLYIGTPLLPDYDASPHGVWLDMDPKQRKAYDQMLKTSTADIEGGTLSAVGVLAELTRLKQFSTCYGKMEGDEFIPQLPSNKFDYLVQMLEELGYPDDPQAKIVVASQFTKVLNLFGKEMEKTYGEKMVGYITGEVTGPRRHQVIDDFNRPLGEGMHLLFLNTKAGGSAITLDAADEMVVLDETWIPDDQVQLEGRIDNRRPEEKIVQRRYRYLRSANSVEAGIALTNMERGMFSHEVLDGRRGVGWAREVLEKAK